MESSALSIRDLNVEIRGKAVLRVASLDVPPNQLMTLIGPPDSGKSILLRAVNRLLDDQPGVRRHGTIALFGKDVDTFPLSALRARIGMVFPDPVIFPHWTLYENILAGQAFQGIKLSKTESDRIVEQVLRRVRLWDDLRGDLHHKSVTLDTGRRQQLCLARILAHDPQVLLFDEPTRNLDIQATTLIEDLATELKSDYTILWVTQYIAQAAKISDLTAFLHQGELVECNLTERLLTVPQDPRTEDYLSGRLGYA